MTTNVLIAFYSTYGHVHRMALAVAKGAESVTDVTVRLRRIAHNRPQSRQSACSHRGLSQGPQGKSCVRAIAWETIR